MTLWPGIVGLRCANPTYGDYVVPADPYQVFAGRRAAREAVWAWTVLTESV